MSEEWAIQDEASGLWWEWTCSWGSKPHVFSSYRAAAKTFDGPMRLHARIVPAPPREMTDAECLEWLKKAFAQLGFDAGEWRVSRWNYDAILYGTGNTAYDAIRAARKKLESK